MAYLFGIEEKHPEARDERSSEQRGLLRDEPLDDADEEA